MKRIQTAVAALLFTFIGPVLVHAETVTTVTEQAIQVDGAGNVGVGTSPLWKTLSVQGTADSTGLVIQNINSTIATRNVLQLRSKGSVEMSMHHDDAGKMWRVVANENIFMFDLAGNGAAEMTILANGDLVINGTCLEGGGGTPCDGVFDPGFQLESIEDHAQSMYSNRHLPAIGPTPEGEQIRFEVQKRHFAVLNELEKAHVYIDQLNTRLKTEESRRAALERNIGPGGRLQEVSTRGVKTEIAGLNADDALEAVLALEPVRFAYKENPEEEHLGFIAEDVPEVVSIEGREAVARWT